MDYQCDHGYPGKGSTMDYIEVMVSYLWGG